MDIFFTNLVISFTAYFDVGPDAAFTKTMIAFKKDFVSQPMLVDITLNNFQQVFISSCKAGTSKTDNDFTAMIHYRNRIAM